MNNSNFIGYFEHSLPSNVLVAGHLPAAEIFQVSNDAVIKVTNLLLPGELDALVANSKGRDQVSVGLDGYYKTYKEGDFVCSKRSTFYDQNLADLMYERVAYLMKERMNPYEDEAVAFKPFGVNPAMRMIEYTTSGFLVPHYDLPYRESDEKTTLYSMVVYLQAEGHDAGTRFIKEHRGSDRSDWERPALDSEVLLDCRMKAGEALIFPHGLLHEGLRTESAKMIMRTDIVYSRENKHAIR
jgi:hypothetical protein